MTLTDLFQGAFVVDRFKGFGRLFLWISIVAMLGCDPGTCDDTSPCQDGSYCSRKETDSKGICVWGMLDPETNKTVPDIRINLTKGVLSVHQRTNTSPLLIHIDVFGAPRGIEVFFFRNAQPLPSPCKEYSKESKGEVQRLRCELPILEEGHYRLEEGHYRLEVLAHGAQGSSRKVFEWIYDITPPKVKIEIEHEGELRGRDDVLNIRVQALEGSEDIDWDRSELLVGPHRFSSIPCPGSLPSKPHARCFKLSLSVLSDLPHGPYTLNVTTRLMDELGNWEEKQHEHTLHIDRVLWTTEPRGANLQLVVTQEGEVVVPSANGKFLEAIDVSNGQPRRTYSNLQLGQSPKNPVLLGNHLGTQVLITTCSTEQGAGLQIFNVATGDSPRSCVAPIPKNAHIPSLALVRGGQEQELVLARTVVQDSMATLEICRLTDLRQSQANFVCQSYVGLPQGSTLVVRAQEGEDTTVYMSAVDSRVVFSFEREERSTMPVGSLFGSGWRSLWGTKDVVLLNEKGNELPSRRFFNEAMTPLAIDAIGDDDQLLYAAGSTLYRYSSKLQRSIQQAPIGWSPKEGFILEGGNILLAGGSWVAVFNSELQKLWEGNLVEFGAGWNLKQATFAPFSSTRGVLVVEMEGSKGQVKYGGILMDSRGLKPGAPWPMRGGDPCQSFNLGVQAHNCWDGISADELPELPR